MRVETKIVTEMFVSEAELRRLLKIPKGAFLDEIGDLPWDQVLKQDGDVFMLRIVTEQTKRVQRKL